MSDQHPLDVQKRWAEIAMSGNLDAFDDILDPSIVDHDPAPDQGPGPAGFKQFFTALRAAFPDLKITPAHAIETGDEVAIAYTIEGTHNGPFLGVPPTGTRIKARGLQIARFENGKAVERWGSSDELGILKQIGTKIGP
jgi:predicted ester cyclase